MREAINRIISYTQGISFSEFKGDNKTQDAVLRNLEVLGEASKNMPDEFTSRYPDIPWREMAGTRDRLIHHYFGVNLDVVWGIVENELPQVITKLKNIMDQME